MSPPPGSLPCYPPHSGQCLLWAPQPLGFPVTAFSSPHYKGRFPHPLSPGSRHCEGQGCADFTPNLQGPSRGLTHSRQFSNIVEGGGGQSLLSTDYVPHIRHFTNVLIQSLSILKGASTLPKSWERTKAQDAQGDFVPSSNSKQLRKRKLNQRTGLEKYSHKQHSSFLGKS